MAINSFIIAKAEDMWSWARQWIIVNANKEIMKLLDSSLHCHASLVFMLGS